MMGKEKLILLLNDEQLCEHMYFMNNYTEIFLHIFLQ